MPSISRAAFDNMMTDEGFQTFERQDFKGGQKLTLDGEKVYTDRRVVSKVLKLDGNNQYGYAMAKSQITGCMKKLEKVPTGTGSNMLFQPEQATLKHNNVQRTILSHF